ncbi:MAG: hypothetical protein ACREQV_13330, partial [Candidatus Binatia bacterium]
MALFTSARPVGLDEVNDAMDLGLRVDALVITPGDWLEFNRAGATPSQLSESFGYVARRLNVEPGSIAVPRDLEPEAGELIHFAAGPGYRAVGTNPNASGMGLLTAERGLALAALLSDAPAALVIHPCGVIAAVSGIWHQLPKGVVNRTIAHMRFQVEGRGKVFSLSHLRV